MTEVPFQFRLDSKSGVPAYRQLIDQVLASVAGQTLTAGEQLPTVRSVAVQLAINPNTVMRAYKELEIRGVLETQQGTGTFVSSRPVAVDEAERARRLEQFSSEVAARCGAEGFRLEELLGALRERNGGAE